MSDDGGDDDDYDAGGYFGCVHYADGGEAFD